MFAYFKQGGHQPEVVIYRHLRHLAGPCKDIPLQPSVYEKSVVFLTRERHSEIFKQHTVYFRRQFYATYQFYSISVKHETFRFCVYCSFNASTQ